MRSASAISVDNTRPVPPDQVPKTYDSLLDPRLRNKLAWRMQQFGSAVIWFVIRSHNELRWKNAAGKFLTISMMRRQHQGV